MEKVWKCCCYPETNRSTRNNLLGESSSSHKEIAVDGISIITDFTSDHEEADTWLIVLAFVVNLSTRYAIMVQSPSGKIDILA